MDYDEETESLRRDIEKLLNQHSRENMSGTPDFILADYLIECLLSYEKSIVRTKRWHEPPDDADSDIVAPHGHTTTRTSPFGEKYLGTCINCGAENLEIDDMSVCPVSTTKAQDLIAVMEK